MLELDNQERKEGIHASDLLDPRLAFFSKKIPKGPTERQVWFFVIGKILHQLVLGLEDRSDSGTRRALGLLYSPDFFVGQSPVELKSTRSQYEPYPHRLVEEYQRYLAQLLIYLVCEGVYHGKLWILYLTLKEEGSHRTSPTVRCYDVTLTEEQFEEIKTEILETKALLERAIKEDDHSILPLCQAFLCGKSNCPYWLFCKPEGRFPETDRKRWTK